MKGHICNKYRDKCEFQSSQEAHFLEESQILQTSSQTSVNMDPVAMRQALVRLGFSNEAATNITNVQGIDNAYKSATWVGSGVVDITCCKLAAVGVNSGVGGLLGYPPPEVMKHLLVVQCSM